LGRHSQRQYIRSWNPTRIDIDISVDSIKKNNGPYLRGRYLLDKGETEESPLGRVEYLVKIEPFPRVVEGPIKFYLGYRVAPEAGDYRYRLLDFAGLSV
jgi:hypothetical protein